MLSFPTTKSSTTMASLALACLISAAALLASPPIVQGDSQETTGFKIKQPGRPTPQNHGIVPIKGPAGTRISVTGVGFRDFALVESVTLGGVDILDNRTTFTDGDGNFYIEDLVVPGLDPGVVALTIRVGSGVQVTNAIGTFEITGPARSSGSVTPTLEALAPLGDDLDRVFHFENNSKLWSFFDPRPSFLDANSLAEIREGQVYWIKVARSLTVELNGRQRVLTCAYAGTAKPDCWNLVVW